MLRPPDLFFGSFHGFPGRFCCFLSLFPDIFRYPFDIEILVCQIPQQHTEQNASAKAVMPSAKDQMSKGQNTQ
jgi:hypothetical protein